MSEASQMTPTERGDICPTTISKAAQAAWEAPALRPVFTPSGKAEQWAHPCPDWCDGEGLGHDLFRTTAGPREHQSPPLRVRTDGALAFYGMPDDGDAEGVTAGHLEVSLMASSRTVDQPRVKVRARWGKDGEPKSFGLAPLYFDEVRELICVLQHLLQVGQEGGAK